MAYNGQAEQDKFVLNVLKNKRNGFFVEIGSNHPVNISNSFLLESQYGWRGIMVEYDSSFLPLYEQHRPNSIHVINDATKIDYLDLFTKHNLPSNIDYLQIDLEASNMSTINTLIKLDKEVLDIYKFSVVTFEHDIYSDSDKSKTRETSRDIFLKRGYKLVFPDIHNTLPKYVYEDWYVHPDLVDMNYIDTLIQKNVSNYEPNTITGKSIGWDKIMY